MVKTSYDMNHSQIHPNERNGQTENTRRDSIVADGPSKTSTAGYIVHCSLSS